MLQPVYHPLLMPTFTCEEHFACKLSVYGLFPYSHPSQRIAAPISHTKQYLRSEAITNPLGAKRFLLLFGAKRPTPLPRGKGLGDGDTWGLVLWFMAPQRAINEECQASFDVWHSKEPQLPTLPPGGAVPSAMVSLTSLFGMGRGGSSPL